MIRLSNHPEIIMPGTALKPVDSIELKAKNSTWAKTSAAQASSLSADEKFMVKSGETLNVLASYTQDKSGHINVTIAEGSTDIGQTFCLYGHDFPDRPQVIEITGTMKIQQAGGGAIDKIFPGTCLELKSYAPAKVGDGDNYAQIEFANPYKGHAKWDVYHSELSAKSKITGCDPDNNPTGVANAVEEEYDRGQPITVPAFTCPNDGTRKTQVYLGEYIVAGGHFTWAEATKYGSRIPTDEGVMNGIIRIARVMETVRSKLGNKPIRINSWYRDPASNRAVGGARYSRHMSGDAVDFVVEGMHPYDVYDLLNPWWGNKGGLASATCFTHIDARGAYSRWSYNFAWLIMSMLGLVCMF